MARSLDRFGWAGPNWFFLLTFSSSSSSWTISTQLLSTFTLLLISFQAELLVITARLLATKPCLHSKIEYISCPPFFHCRFACIPSLNMLEGEQISEKRIQLQTVNHLINRRRWWRWWQWWWIGTRRNYEPLNTSQIFEQIWEKVGD